MQAPYDDIADPWDAARDGFRPNEAEFLAAFLGGLPPGAAVLDLGCGTGRPIAVAVAAAGLHVVGVDRSRALLDRARRRLPAVEWIEADLLAVDFPPGRFAGVICWDALFHTDRVHHRPALERAHGWLRPGGRLMLSSGGSAVDLPAFTDAMFGHAFFYDAHPTGEMTRLVADVGFDVDRAEIVDPPDGGRNKGKWGILATKRA